MKPQKVNFKIKIRKGDTVKVISGEDKGKQGRVLFIDTKKYRALVEDVNIISRHTKPNAANPDGGIIKKEAPIHISNLMLIDPKSGSPTKVGRRMEGDRIVRFNKKTGDQIN